MSTHRVGIVVPHTHWDRAWYLPFQAYRLRLVEMVADLLTKIVVGSQDQRLSLRFFSLIPESDCKVTACICIRVD